MYALQETRVQSMDLDTRFEHIRDIGGARYQAFLDAGYREFYMGMSPWSTPYLLQKAIRNSDGIRLFFIDILVYDFSHVRTTDMQQISFQPECQFNDHVSATTPCFRVILNDADTRTPEDIETFFSHIYISGLTLFNIFF